MKRTLLLIAIILFSFCSITAAAQITGEGVGETREEAKKEALADLCQQIKVEVKSEFKSAESVTGSDYDKQVVKKINLDSDLPLMGVEYQILKKRKHYYCLASLDNEAVVKFEAELAHLKAKLDQHARQLSKVKSNDAQLKLLNEMLTQLDQYEKLSIVARFLKSTQIPELTVSKADILNRLSNLNQKADTIDFGIKKTAEEFRAKDIYVYPPTIDDTSEITEFASAVKDRLCVHLDTVQTPGQADHFIMGEYRILKQGIEMTLHLLDSSQNTMKTNVVFLMPVAYKNYQIKPKTANFDHLLKNGMVVSGRLRAQVTTSLGKKDLVFKRHDTFKILVKMNKPGYFYFLVHNHKGDDAYSYLVDFYDAAENRKFVYHIGADDVNKWIELGEFKVVPPFGVESIQMIASTEDLIHKLPAFLYDIKTELYKVEGNPSNVVTKTRGFIRQDRLEKQTAVTEDVLILTTLDK